MKMRPLYSAEEQQSLIKKYSDIAENTTDQRIKNRCHAAIVRIAYCPYVIERAASERGE